MANIHPASVHDFPMAGEVELSSPARQAYRILHLAFILAPIIAGIDKFFHMLVNWDMYLAPWLANLSPIGGHNLMLVVGGIEILAGLIVAFKPKVGTAVVFA